MHSQHRHILKHAFPPSGLNIINLTIVFIRAEVISGCYKKLGQLKAKPPGQALTATYQEERLKRWRDEEDVFLSDFFPATSTNVVFFLFLSFFLPFIQLC